MGNIPPEGSKIESKQDLNSITYSWKDDFSNFHSFKHIFTCSLLFLGWAVFGAFMIHQYLFDPDENPPLFAWTCWGCFILAPIFMMYITFKTVKPFELTLSPGRIRYKAGDINVDLNKNYRIKKLRDIKDFFRKVSKLKKEPVEINISEIRNLALEREGERQVLSLSYGDEELEIGDMLMEPEREWLYKVLKEHIGI